MLKVGVTGGIGSGKSYVCNVFAELGVPVYNADEKAKIISESSQSVKTQIIKEFGEKAYFKSKLNRPYLAEIVFNDTKLLEKLNSIIHPAVEADFIMWCSENQKQKYVIKEAAILFETGIYKKLDKTIVLIASEQTRIQRIIERDKSSKEDILRRMNNQWPTEKIKPLADFIIENCHNTLILPQILRIDKKLRS